jgi:hypothetical protein
MKPVYVVILAVVVAAAAFWGGMTYEKSKAASFAGAGAGGRFAGRFGGGAAGGGQRMTPVSGQIVNTGSNTITVKLSDGSSKIVDLTGQTMISKSSKGSASDLTTGQQVTAFGATNSDGSITAQAVNVGNGMMRMRQGGGQPSGSQSSGQ